MRVSREQAQASRRRIVDTAASLFRQHGFDGVGISDLMKASGMTHGGFYRHFPSKDDLAAEASSAAYREFEKDSAGKSVDALLRRYISKEHRDDPGAACPTSVLGAEAVRQSDPVRGVFAGGVANWLDILGDAMKDADGLGDVDRRAMSIHLAALAVGSIVLSRAAAANGPLSDEILDVGLSKALSATT